MLTRRLPLALCLMVAAPAGLEAQQSATLNRFSASAMPADDFQIDRPVAPGHFRFGAQIHADHGLEPLIYLGAQGDGPEQEAVVVGHEVRLNAGLSLGLGERFLVFAGLPVVAFMDGDDDPMIGTTRLPQHDDPGLGDAYAGARAVLLGDADDLLGLAVQVAGTFPTAGSDQRFRGDEFLSFLPELLVALRPGGGARITANLGARVRRAASEPTSNLKFGHEFSYALGFAIPVWTGHRGGHFDLHAQAFGTTTFEDVEGTPMEALGGFKYFHDGGFVVGAGAGPGVTRGFGSPVFRSVVTIGYQTPAEIDSDGDGLLDGRDGCPNKPEDRDDFQDNDGCPDPDNDGDGIQDGADQCPNKPETDNGFEDDDGCPDQWGDQDGDGMLDNVDKCPEQPEDLDSFEDDDGCPDPDNDQDGVLDVDDKCPLEKGVTQEAGCPVKDRDGDTVPDDVDNCPDEHGKVQFQGCNKPQKVIIEKTRLQLLDKVYFKTGNAVIQQRSFPLLDDVAAALSSHPDIERVIIEGHTDARGRRKFNLKLSEDRAVMVRAYLISKGINGERLEARGYGPDRPRVPNARTKEDHAQNRRVEFKIPEPVVKMRPADGASEDGQ